MNAFESLRNDYSLEEFNNFIEHGCASSCPNNHWNYTQTKEFYLEYEGEILEMLEDATGESAFRVFGWNCDNINMLMNNMVWAYIERVALMVVDEANY
jgi:hypothetical protein